MHHNGAPSYQAKMLYISVMASVDILMRNMTMTIEEPWSESFLSANCQGNWRTHHKAHVYKVVYWF